MISIKRIFPFGAFLWITSGLILSCSSSFSQALNACFTFQDATVCENALVSMFDCTSGGTPPYTYSWNFAGQGTSTVEDPVWTFVGTGPFTVTLTVTDNKGFADQTTGLVRVFNSPTASFSVDDAQGCRPQTVCFTDNSVMGDAPLTTWSWTFGDGANSSQASPCHAYATPGTYTVNVLVMDTNGCYDTEVLSAGVTVYDNPRANFTNQPTSVACNVPATFTFTDASLQADTNGVPIVSWVWNFGDGSALGSGTPVSHTYNATGPYSVKLVVTDQNGCKDSITKTIYVDNFDIFINTTAPGDTSGCEPHTVAFIGSYYSVLGATGKPGLYSWSFPGGNPPTAVTTTGPTTAISYSNPGSYNVIVTATNGFSCSATDTFVINVYPLPDINFSADTTKSCQAPFPVTFTDNTPDAAGWIWDFENSGDWSIDDTNNPTSHTYDTGCYNVSLIVTNIYNCIDTAVRNNYICVKEPIADFYTDTFCGCVPFIVGFRDTSKVSNIFPFDSIVTWHWDFGDGWFIEGGDSLMIGDTTNNCLTRCAYRFPTHTYVDTGTYDSIMLIITTSLGCRDTVYSSTASSCDPNSPFCTSGCGVGIGIKPNAAFYVDDTMGCFPFSITPKFNNLSSTYSNFWQWDFQNDGQIDNEEFEPPYTYSDFPDTFSVMLVAKMHECNDTSIREDYIHVLSSKADFTISSDFFGTDGPYAFCYGDSQITGGWEITVRDTSYHANYWMFDFGDTNAWSYDTKDTCFKMWDDTLFVLDDSTFFNDSLINFWVPPNPADPYCNNFYSIYVAEDTAIITASATPPTTPWTLDTVFFPGDTVIYNCDTLILPPMNRIAYSQTLCLSGDTFFYFNMGHSPLTTCDSARMDSMADCIDTFYVTTDVLYTYWLVDSSYFWDDSMFVNYVDTDTTLLNVYYPDFVDGDPATTDMILIDSVTLCSNQKYYRYMLLDETAYVQDSLYREPVRYYQFYSDQLLPCIVDGDPMTIDTALVDSTVLHRLVMIYCNDTVPLIPDIRFYPSDTIVADTFTLITQGGMIIDSATTTPYGCDMTIVQPADTTILIPDTIISTSWMDTVCIDYASLQVKPNTTVNLCYVTITLPDTSLDLLTDDFIIPANPVLLVEDSLGNQLFSSSVTYMAFPDVITVQLSAAACAGYDTSYMVNGYISAIRIHQPDTLGLKYFITPPDTNSYTSDTICPDTIWHNCQYEMSKMVFPVTTETIIPYDLDYRPYPFNHTFTKEGVYTITLYTRNSETECIDSTTRDVMICRIRTGFDLVMQPANGCEPVKANFYDTTLATCGATEWIWDFGDGCAVYYNQQFATSTDPIDPMWIFGFPNCNINTVSGTYVDPVKDYSNGGSFTVTLVKADTYGCIDSVSKSIEVHDTPLPGFKADVLNGCTGLEVNFCDTNYYTEPNDIVKWIWTYKNVTANPPVTVIDTTDIPCDDFIFNIAPASGPQNYFDVTLQVLDEFGCTYTLLKPQYINVTRATASIVFDNTWCDDKALTIASNSSVTSPATYSWDFCDGTVYYDTSSTISHTWMVDTCDTFNITLYITDVYGCSDDTTMPVYIADPKVYFGIDSIGESKCPPIPVYFADSSKTECDTLASWLWDFGDGYTSNMQNPSHTYEAQGVYDVSLIITTGEGCTDTLKRDSLITIGGPKLLSDIYPDTVFCIYTATDTCLVQLTFELTVVNTKWIVINYGDGDADSLTLSTNDTTTVTFVHCYEDGGTYSPNIYLWDILNPPPEYIYPCGFAWLDPVTVNAADVDFMTSDTICGPRQVNFTNTSSNISDIDYWLWDFGDGNTSNNFHGSNYYANEGVYDVSLYGFNEVQGDVCISKEIKIKYVTVFNLPHPPAEGCPPLEVTFYLDSSAMDIPLNMSTLVWDFGDGSADSLGTGNPVTHTYTATGDSIKYTYYNVTATFDNGCYFEWDSLVLVYPVPSANFTMDPMVQGSTISTINFINASGGDTMNQIYYWDFGDGDEGTTYYPIRDVTHSYAATGEFTVTLVVEDNNTKCRDTIQKTVQIKIKVPNIFTPNGDGTNEYFNLDIPDGMIDLQLMIFNRWGIKIYESDDYPSDCSDGSPNKDRCWDGRDMHGNPVNNDTYFYILNLDHKAVFNGWVMVLREKK